MKNKKNMQIMFVNNDTFAVIGMIVVAIVSLFFEQETIASSAIGAVGGYLGSKYNNT